MIILLTYSILSIIVFLIYPKEAISMKRIVKAVLCAAVALIIFGCETTDSAMNGGSVKKPEMVDHKNQKWGKTPPEWVSMERDEIEAMDKYKDVYIFKFESEKSKDLEGTQLWLRNFSATTELSKMITQRIKDVSAAAAVGDKNALGTYMEEIVRSVSEAELHGLKKEADYWTQQRYFTADGEVEGDFYTVQVLYSIPRRTLDKLIADAINGVEKPKTEEEVRARNLVNKALREDF